MLGLVQVPVIMPVLVYGLELKPEDLVSRGVEVQEVGGNPAFCQLGDRKNDDLETRIEEESLHAAARPVFHLSLIYIWRGHESPAKHVVARPSGSVYALDELGATFRAELERVPDGENARDHVDGGSGERYP